MLNSVKFSVLNSHLNVRKMSVQVLKEIFTKSVESVQPQNLITKQVSVSSGHLTVCGHTYPLHKPCYVVGFGKAVLGMALELEKLLKDKLKMGVVTVPKGIFENLEIQSSIKFIEGARNNIPDEEALSGALEIKALVESLEKDDLLIVLISGGGSALLPLPRPPVTLTEKQNLIRELSIRGADILELNCVRKQISVLKGGGLAELAFPSRVISLILSDVVGDPLDFIASGPTTPNCDNGKDAITIINKYKCYEGLSAAMRAVLGQKRENCYFPPVKDGKYEHVDNFVIGNNQIAAEAARQHAASFGFQSTIISTSVTGNVAQISQIYADLARTICNSSSKQTLKDFLETCGLCVDPSAVDTLISFDLAKEICVIAAGEPTVVVNGSGKGGRNQQLALELSVRLNKLNIKSADISFLSAGTDGIDGPTDAAGAIGTSDLVNNSLEENIKPDDYLNNNDSYTFYSKYLQGEHLIKIGHTGTNVMDIHVMLIKPKRK
ncbi:glycerate kinase [Tribolium castaneum]|uniref:glycerate kinase n=1 Tax=Tribolium castaneum TaxID=7070 RepID=UPI0030FE1496